LPNVSGPWTFSGPITLGNSLKTAAGSSVFNATSSKLAVGTLGGYKVMIPFHVKALATSANTYISPSNGTVAMLTGTARTAHVPWAGSILSMGVRSSTLIAAGHVTFTAHNGSTALGATVTLNTTAGKSNNTAAYADATYPFAANALKVKAKSSSDLTASSYVVFVWASV